MQKESLTMVELVLTYRPLLVRYGRCFVRNHGAAESLATEAIQNYYNGQAENPTTNIRKDLKRHISLLCNFWRRHQPASSVNISRV